MSEERKRTIWPWVAALLVGLPMMYVASFGPACWLVDHGYLAARPIAKTYLPIVRILEDDSSVGSAANAYCGLGAEEPEFTTMRLLDAAGLLVVDGGIMWPDLLRRDAPHRSNDYDHHR